MPQSANRYLVALAILAVFAGATHAIRVQRDVGAEFAPDFSRIPLEIGPWKGEDQPLDMEVYEYLGAAGMVERRYEGPAEPVHAIVLYAANWRSLHSPAGCLPVQGWQTVGEQEVSYEAPPEAPVRAPVRARLMRMHKGDVRLLVLFSLIYHGGSTSSLAAQGWNVAWSPGKGGVNIQLNTPVVDGRWTEAEERLREIFLGMYPAAISFWYDEG